MKKLFLIAAVALCAEKNRLYGDGVSASRHQREKGAGILHGGRNAVHRRQRV